MGPADECWQPFRLLFESVFLISRRFGKFHAHVPLALLLDAVKALLLVHVLVRGNVRGRSNVAVRICFAQ